MARLPIRKTEAQAPRKFLSSLLTHLPGAWLSPSEDELVSLYHLRYRMAMEEKKYDIALVFLSKILEIQPRNFDVRLCKAEIYHLHTKDFGQAVDHYKKVMRMAPPGDDLRERARSSLSQLIEMVS